MVFRRRLQVVSSKDSPPGDSFMLMPYANEFSLNPQGVFSSAFDLLRYKVEPHNRLRIYLICRAMT